jgi:hypothetical protein
MSMYNIHYECWTQAPREQRGRWKVRMPGLASLRSLRELRRPAVALAKAGRPGLHSIRGKDGAGYLTAEPAWTGGAVRVHGATRS